MLLLRMLSARLRVSVLFCFLVLAGISGFYLTRLNFAFSFLDFFPDEDPELEYYHAFEAKFKKGNPNIVVAFHRKEGVFEEKFLVQVADFTRNARNLPGAHNATSLTNLKDFVYDPVTPFQEPVLHYRDPKSYATDSIRILNDPRLVNNYISASGQTLVVTVEADSLPNLDAEEAFTNSVYGLCEQYKLESHIGGFPVLNTVVMRTNEREFRYYIVIACSLLLLAMSFIFRRFWGILIASLSVGLAMILFFGLLGFTGKKLDLMSTLYPILIVIVGTSDVVHIMTRYADELYRGLSREQALRATIKEIGVATLLTSLTTAIGFASLFSSQLPPIRNFGLFAAIGVFIAYFTVIIFTTVAISFFDGEKLMAPQGKAKFWAGLMDWFYIFTKKYPKQIIVSILILLLLSGLGISQISLNVMDDRDVPRGTKFYRDYDFIQREMKGIGTLDYGIEAAGDHRIDDLVVLREIEKLESFISQQPEVGSIYSTLMLFKTANQSFNYNQPEAYCLPANDSLFLIQKSIINEKHADLTRHLVSEDGKTGKLILKIPNLGTQVYAELSTRIDLWINQNSDPEKVSFVKTGIKYLFNTNQDKLVASLFKSIGLAFIMVGLLMGLVFKNVKMVLLSLIPNIIPLIFTGGLIGFLGFALDAKIAIVFTIAFGIAVDDTIHYLARFRLERLKGATVDFANQATLRESGKAIVMTTLILFSCFGSLASSSFPPTYTIGTLIAITLALALLADLFLLPVLLNWALKDKDKA